MKNDAPQSYDEQMSKDHEMVETDKDTKAHGENTKERKETMITKEIVAVNQSTDLTFTRKPKEVLEMATEASRALKDVVTKAGLITKIGPSEHLQFEAWQTLGQFYGVTVMVSQTKELQENGSFYGYEAYASVLKNGDIISKAEAMCCIDEPNWKSKPRFQLRSMAQTRACGKALRNVLSWIVVLAGYKPTPAEEMSGDEYTNNNQGSDSPTIKNPNDPPTEKQIKAACAICKHNGDILNEKDFASMTKGEISEYISKNQGINR